MHLDRRGYAYESYRQNGKVKRRYFGGGAVGHAIASLSALDRQEEDERRQEQKQIRERLLADGEHAVLQLQLLSAQCNALVKACLMASGFHRPKRGLWRKKREARGNDMTKPQTKAKELPARSGDTLPTDPKEVRALFDRATNGDKDAALLMLKEMKGKPDEREFLELIAAPFKNARQCMLVAPVAKGNELGRLAIDRQFDLMRDELAGPNPSPLELMLAERVTICYAQVMTLQALHGNSLSESFKTCEILGRQLDAAHRRHLEAVKALAMVRKLKLPNIQVNIGEKQVNVGGDAAVVSVEEGPRGRVVEGTVH